MITDAQLDHMMKNLDDGNVYPVSYELEEMCSELLQWRKLGRDYRDYVFAGMEVRRYKDDFPIEDMARRADKLLAQIEGEE